MKNELTRNIKFVSSLLITICLTFGLSLSLQSLLAAWQPPGSIPPAGNTNPPVYNVNPNPSDTVHIGTSTAIYNDLSIGGNSVIFGKLGVGVLPNILNINLLVNGNIGGDKICTADGLICHDIASLSSGGGGYKILRGFVSVTFTNGQPESQHLPVTFPELCNNPTVIAVAKDYSNSIKCGTISGPSLCCNNTSSLSQDLDAVVSLITTNGFTTWLTGDCGVWADDHPTYPIDWLAICDSAGGGGTNWWSQFENNIYNNNPGNVGVGVNSPAYKLHVNGDVNATRLCINGNCKTNWPVEDDPQVGTLTNGRWCTSNGNVVNCNQTAPLMSYTEIDPKVGTITVGGWCRGSTASLLNCNNSLPVPRLICADVNRVTTPTQLSCTQTCASWYTNGACIGAADHGDPNFHGYVRDCDIIDSGIPGCRCCRVSW